MSSLTLVLFCPVPSAGASADNPPMLSKYKFREIYSCQFLNCSISSSAFVTFPQQFHLVCSPLCYPSLRSVGSEGSKKPNTNIPMLKLPFLWSPQCHVQSQSQAVDCIFIMHQGCTNLQVPASHQPLAVMKIELSVFCSWKYHKNTDIHALQSPVPFGR